MNEIRVSVEQGRSAFSTRAIGALLTCALILAPFQIVARDFLYTNNNEAYGSTVSAFAVDASGTLTEVTGSPFATGAAGYGVVGVYASQGMAISPNGPFVFVADGGGCGVPNNGCVSAFKIEPSDGSLTLVGNLPLPVGFNNSGGAASLAVTPDGHFLFAASYLAQVIYTMRIAPDGTLTFAEFQIPGFQPGETPAKFPYQDLRTLAVSPNGKFLAAGVGYDGVAMFGIGANGSLTPVPGSPFSSAGSTAGVEFNAASDRIYAGEALFGNPTVDVFSVAATNGVLSPLTSSPFAALGGINSNVVLLSPDEGFVFVSNQGSASITTFGVGLEGGLSVAAGSPFSLDTGASFPTLMSTNAEGTALYVVDNAAGASGISVLNIDGEGRLTPAQRFPVISTTPFPAAIVGIGVYHAPPQQPDTTPPSIQSVTASPNTLWPPNHKMVAVTVIAIASDQYDPAPVCKISSVASNEPVNGTGDGDTAPDWEITGALTANLRAERAGNGSGRVYTLTVECADQAGNSATKKTTVTVPHD